MAPAISELDKVVDPVGAAVSVLKGVFRGGDPELLQQKKEEKRQEQEDAGAGDEVSLAIKILKADAGSDPGQFRGGDPELLLQKKEEKRQEQEDSGVFEEVIEDEPDQADIEEAQQQQQDRDDAAGKSVPFSLAGAGTQVSPVDYGDYNPRNHNGDPWFDAQNIKQSNIEPGPIRRGKNQWKPWSEVLGFKIPPEGAPWQHLRRYAFLDEPGVAQKEVQLLARSVEEFPEYEERVKKAFFTLWDRLNSGITFDPEYQIYKAEKGEVVAGHKYIFRKMGSDGRWVYQYTNAPHTSNHGIQETGNQQGHSIDMHPDWAAEDPNGHNPEGGFHHARSKALDTPAQYPIDVTDLTTLQPVRHMLVIKPDNKHKPLALHEAKTTDKGEVVGKRKRQFAGFKSFEDFVRSTNVNTEHDIHGKPWFQWKSAGEKSENKPPEMRPDEFPEDFKKRLEEHKKKASKQRLEIRYHKDSAFAKDPPEGQRQTPGADGKGNWHQGPMSVHALEKRVAKERAEQAAIALNPEGPRYYKPVEQFAADPDNPRPHTAVLESGQFPRTEKKVTRTIQTAAGVRAAHSRTITQTTHELQVPSDKRLELSRNIAIEHGGMIHKLATDIIRGVSDKQNEPFSGQHQRDLVAVLTVEPTIAAINRTMDEYNPSMTSSKDPTKGVRFSSFLYWALKGEMRHALAETLKQGGTSTSEEGHAALQAKQARSAVQSEMASAASTKPEEVGWGDTSGSEFSSLSGIPGVDEADILEELPVSKYLAHGGGVLADGSSISSDDVREMRQSGKDRGVKTGADRGAPDSLDNIVDLPISFLGFEHPTLTNYIEKNDIQTVGELQAAMQDKKRTLPDKDRAAVAGELQQRLFEAEWEARDAAGGGRVSKAVAQEPSKDQSGVSYVGQAGSLGAQRYMYETGNGNIVHGTNAPEDHDDHVPGLGPPVVHPNEPTPDTNPEMFDAEGRKLDRPVPQDAEDNPEYNPDKTTGNSWAKRFSDPETGDTNYAYYHRDQVLDPKMQNNLSLKYVDAQLPKIRTWYQSLIADADPQQQAVGLFVALADQGHVAPGDLESLAVKDVRVSDNTATFATSAGQVQVALDGPTSGVLEQLMEGKAPEQPLFSLNGQQLRQVSVNKFFTSTFGVAIATLQTYHITARFSVLFQQMLSKLKTSPSTHELQDLKDQVLQQVSEEFGVPAQAVAQYIDPIAVEAAMMSAFVHKALCKSHKLQDRYTFQGMPISIENRKGSVRHWHDQNADKDGQTKMLFDYGYINRTKGVDGDHVDVFVGPDESAEVVFVVHQMKAPKFTEFDEDKVMVGFPTADAATSAYSKHYDSPKFFGGCTAMSVEKFKDKVLGAKRACMIKAMVWTVTSGLTELTPEEKLFSQWVHSYPMHEHEQHWGALQQHAQQQDQKQAEMEQQQEQQQTQVPQGLLGTPSSEEEVTQ